MDPVGGIETTSVRNFSPVGLHFFLHLYLLLKGSSSYDIIIVGLIIVKGISSICTSQMNMFNTPKDWEGNPPSGRQSGKGKK